ncbi:hypothetical protein P7C70_g7313, partial [Phenoliferia sp. Uapishka_3]
MHSLSPILSSLSPAAGSSNGIPLLRFTGGVANLAGVRADQRIFVLPPGYKTATSEWKFSDESNQEVNYALSHGVVGGTLGNYGAGILCFESWADTNGIPSTLRWPLQTEVLRRYLAHLVKNGWRTETCTRRISTLRIRQGFHNVPWIVDENALLPMIAAIKAADPGPGPERDPLLITELDAIFHGLDWTKNYSFALWAAVLFGFWGLCRTGEFTVDSQNAFNPKLHIKLMDVKVITATSLDGKQVTGRSCHLPWTKVKKHLGEDVVLAARADYLCPIKALEEHLIMNAVGPDNSLFSYLAIEGGRRHMGHKSFVSDINVHLVAAGLPPIEGHAIRGGGATQLLLHGVSEAKVRLAGRWSATSTSFLKYWRQIQRIVLLATDASAQVAAVRIPSVSSWGSRAGQRS